MQEVALKVEAVVMLGEHVVLEVTFMVKVAEMLEEHAVLEVAMKAEAAVMLGEHVVLEIASKVGYTLGFFICYDAYYNHQFFISKLPSLKSIL